MSTERSSFEIRGDQVGFDAVMVFYLDRSREPPTSSRFMMSAIDAADVCERCPNEYFLLDPMKSAATEVASHADPGLTAPSNRPTSLVEFAPQPPVEAAGARLGPGKAIAKGTPFSMPAPPQEFARLPVLVPRGVKKPITRGPEFTIPAPKDRG